MNRIQTILWMVLVSFAFSCGNKQGTEEGVSEVQVSDNIVMSSAQFESNELVVGEMEKSDFGDIVSATGVFEVPPSMNATVSTYFEGFVSDVYVLKGENVKKGKALFSLEHPSFLKMQEEFLVAKNDLAELKAELVRQEAMYAEEVNAEKDVLKARTAYQNKEIQTEALKRRLILMNVDPEQLKASTLSSRVNIYAPINGSISELSINKGELVAAGTEAMKILNTTDMHLELRVFENDIARIKVDQLVSFTTQNADDHVFYGKVILVNKAVSSEERTANVHVDIIKDENSLILSPGMFAQAKIHLNEHNAWSLPETAITDYRGKRIALVYTKGKDDQVRLKPIAVEEGKTEDHRIEILNEEELGVKSKFILKGAFLLVGE